MPTPVVDYLLEFDRGFCALFLIEECLAAQVGDLKGSVTFIRSVFLTTESLRPCLLNSCELN